MKKIYVLDTNVLMSTEGKAIWGFEDNIVMITQVTLEELDNLKSYPGERGYEARQAIKCINRVYESNRFSSASEEMVINTDGSFEIYAQETPSDVLPVGWSIDKADNQIISILLKIKNTKYMPVILVTNDLSMKIKAETVGVKTQTYHNERVDIEDEYTGRREITQIIKEEPNYKSIGEIMDKLFLHKSAQVVNEWKLNENEYVILKEEFTNRSAIAYFRKDVLYKVPDIINIHGIIPKNAGQRFAAHALMEAVESIPLVILKGPAGCGKTLLSIAAAMEQINYGNQSFSASGKYDKLVIMRSNTLCDNDQGYLKGTLEEKMMPLLAPYFDNLSYLYTMDGGIAKEGDMIIEDMIDRGIIEIGCFAYIRGRSFANSFVIVDEAQNLTRNQIKTLVTRIGIGTKLVILGDPDQIDTAKLDKKNNGLTYLSEKFKGSKLCAQITFTAHECVRSALANEAIELLK